MKDHLLLTLRNSFAFFSKKEKFKLGFFYLSFLVGNFFDLLGLFLLSITAYVLLNPGGLEAILYWLSRFGLDDFIIQDSQASLFIVLLCCFFVVLILRSIITLVTNRSVFRYLGKKSAAVSQSLLVKLTMQDLRIIFATSTQNRIIALTRSVQSLIADLVSYFLLALSELSLLVAVFALLLIAAPQESLILLITLLFFFGVITSSIGKRVKFEQQKSTQLSVDTQNSLETIFDSMSEIRSTNSISFFAESFGRDRVREVQTLSKIHALGIIPKFIFEIALVLSITLVSLFSFLTDGAQAVLNSVAIVIASSTRVLPSLLRFQTSVNQVYTAVGGSQLVLDLLEKQLASTQKVVNSSTVTMTSPLGGAQSSIKNGLGVELENVLLFQEKLETPIFNNASLTIEPGEFVAIVGPSAAGKSTLLNLIAGLIYPDSGKLVIDHIDSRTYYSQKVTSVYFVPQRINLLNSNIYQNVALGIEADEIERERVLACLERVGLTRPSELSPQDLDWFKQSSNSELSGGQVQRIGIARALYAAPRLVLLDESTSQLDNESELIARVSLEAFRDKATLIMATHRIPDRNFFDRIIQVKSGLITEM